MKNNLNLVRLIILEQYEIVNEKKSYKKEEIIEIKNNKWFFKKTLNINVFDNDKIYNVKAEQDKEVSLCSFSEKHNPFFEKKQLTNIPVSISLIDDESIQYFGSIYSIKNDICSISLIFNKFEYKNLNEKMVKVYTKNKSSFNAKLDFVSAVGDNIIFNFSLKEIDSVASEMINSLCEEKETINKLKKVIEFYEK